MKKYLMIAVAGLAIASCNKMDDYGPQRASDAEAVANAENALGVTIDPNQSWLMTTKVEANIPVKGFYGAKYVVTIYDQNPLTGKEVTVLGRTTVTSGQTANFTFTAPKGLVGVFAAIKDEKGYTYTKPAVIVDGMVETSFGGASASAPGFTRAAAVTRGAADNFTIPTRTMPNLSTYIDDAVAITDANNVTSGGGVEHYLIPEGTTWDKNIPLIQSGSGISVYVQGTLNINAEQRVNGGCVFIVGPKGTVNIASGTQLVTNANNNAGTVGSFYVYPGGKVKGEGTLQFANGTGSYNYNGGTIDVGTINNNGGTLYNAGTIEADHMLGGAGLSIYENAGKVHIGEAAKGSGTANTRIYNNCWWECDGTLACRNIQQGAGAYIKAANLEMSCAEGNTGDVAYIWAKENSLIDISGSAAFNNVDIVGPTEDNNWAYIQLGRVVNSNGHGYQDTALKTNTNYTPGLDGGIQQMTVGAIQNNIRISCDNPETDTNMYSSSAYELVLDMLNGERAYTAGQADPSWPEWRAFPRKGNGNAEIVAKGQVDEVKTESECSPGVVVVPPIIIPEGKPIYSYAFEDTRKGDYDMNDVVIKAQETEDGSKINLTVVASGATLDLNIRLYPAATPDAGKVAKYQGDPTNLKYNNQEEVHAMLGVPSGTMVNTGTGETATPITIQIDKGSYDPAALPLAIYSVKEGEMRLAGAGEAPFGVIIPLDWSWPRERVCITTAYNETDTDEGDQSFGTFASEAGKALNWFNHPTKSVMK